MRHDWRLAAAVLVLSTSGARAEDPADATVEGTGELATVPVQSAAPAQPVAGEGAVQTRGINEIVVTAQKREQSLQDVPVSISTFDGDFMSEKGLVDVGEVAKYTPNVRMNDIAVVTPIMTIRGLGTPPSATGIEPSVGLVIDDISYGRTSYINDAVFDLQRLEILRGPQGTLFGKNTLAGVMNLTTVDPDFSGEGLITAGTGSFNEWRVEAAQSLTLVDDVLAARVALRYRDRNLGVHNTDRDEGVSVKEWAGRVKVKWIVGEGSDLLLNAWKSDVDSVGVPWQLCDASERSLEVMRRYDPEVESDCYNNKSSTNAPGFAKRTSDSVSLKFNHDLADVGFVGSPRFTAVASWSNIEQPYRSDVDFSPLPMVQYGSQVPDVYEQKQVELRLAGTTPAPFSWGESMDFLVGAFGGRSDATTSVRAKIYYEGMIALFEAGAPIPGIGVGIPETGEIVEISTLLGAIGAGQLSESYFSYSKSNAKGGALFSQFDWHLTSAVTATLGLRYGEEHRQGRVAAGTEQPVSLLQSLLKFEVFDESMKGIDRDFSPKGSLSWKINPDVTVFGTVAKGFKAGGFASGVFNDQNLEFDPEKAISYEAGFKSKLFGNTVSLNATAFHTVLDDLQVRSFDGATFYTSNAAGAEASGVEMDVLWVTPLEWLMVGGSAGFTDAKYTDFTCGPGAAGAAAGSGPDECKDQLVGGPAYRDYSGDPLPYAPKRSAALFFSTDFPFGTSWHLVSGFDVLYQGRATVGDGPAFQQPAFTKLSARIGVKSDNGLSLVLNGRNLTGEKEKIWGIDEPNMPGNRAAMTAPSDPTWQLDLRYDWGS